MTLKIVKEPKGSADYNVIVQYDKVTLEVFTLSWLTKRMMEEGVDFYPKLIHQILVTNGIDSLTLEQVDQQLQRK